jgi:hypothetical protein
VEVQRVNGDKTRIIRVVGKYSACQHVWVLLRMFTYFHTSGPSGSILPTLVHIFQ